MTDCAFYTKNGLPFYDQPCIMFSVTMYVGLDNYFRKYTYSGSFHRTSQLYSYLKMVDVSGNYEFISVLYIEDSVYVNYYIK